MMRRVLVLISISLMAMLILSGCSKSKDLKVFIMVDYAMDGKHQDMLQSTLQEAVGEHHPVKVLISPMFNYQKLLVELAAGGNAIMILPEEAFLPIIEQGGAVPLEDVLAEDQYASGIGLDLETEEEHLFGIPLSKSNWFKATGYTGQEAFAFVITNYHDPDAAKEVIVAIAKE